MTVCPKGSGGVPCSPLTPLVNVTGISISNPVTADQNGNYFFCTNTPNKYMVQIGGAGLATAVQDGTVVPGDPQNPVITTLTVTGNATIGGTLGVTGTSTLGTVNNTGGALNGSLGATTPNTITATSVTASGALVASSASVPKSNNHFVIDGCNPGISSPTYAFSSTGINTAIAAAIAAGGGIVDATGCGGQSATMTAEIDVGNASFVPVLLLLPQSGVWTWNLTDGVSYGVKVFNKSSIIGSCTGEGCAMTLQVGNTANMVATVGTPSTGLCGYVKLQGFQAAAASGATLTKAALYITNICDSTRIESVAAVVNGQTGVLVSNACCGIVFQNLVSEGNQVANSVPLVLNEASVINADVTFVGGSFVHPGAGKNAILFSSAAGNNNFGINFLGIHLESNNTDTTTPLVLFPTVAGSARFFGGGQIWQDSSTAYAFNRPAASSFDFTVEGFRMLGGAGADFNAINDQTPSPAVTVLANNTNGLAPHYTTERIFLGSTLQLSAAGQIQFGGAGDNLINRDASGRLKITNNLLVSTLACLANIDTCIGRAAAGLVSSPSISASGIAAGLTGTGACATFSNQTGGPWAGSAKCTGVTAASTLTITPGQTAPNGWTCSVYDETTRANLFQQTSHTTTTCVLTATSVTQNDVFVFKAIAF